MISQSDTMLLRSIKKTAVVLMLMLRLDQPVTATRVSRILDMQHRTASNYLQQLSAAGFVINTSSGYILTQGGSQLLLMDARKTHPINTIESLNFNNKEVNHKENTNSNTRKTRTSEEENQIWITLQYYGIDRNNRTGDLFKLDRLSVSYIDNHADQMTRQGKNLPRWAGLLVKRLEENKCAIPNCSCNVCQEETRDKYKQWE